MQSLEPSAVSYWRRAFGKLVTFKKTFQSSLLQQRWWKFPKNPQRCQKHFKRPRWGTTVTGIWPLNVHTQIMEMSRNEWMWHLVVWFSGHGGVSSRLDLMTLKVFSSLNGSMILQDGSLRKRQILNFIAICSCHSKHICTPQMYFNQTTLQTILPVENQIILAIFVVLHFKSLKNLENFTFLYCKSTLELIACKSASRN